MSAGTVIERLCYRGISAGAALVSSFNIAGTFAVELGNAPSNGLTPPLAQARPSSTPLDVASSAVEIVGERRARAGDQYAAGFHFKVAGAAALPLFDRLSRDRRAHFLLPEQRQLHHRRG